MIHMISPENFVFSKIAGVLRATYPGISLYGATPDKPPTQFPVVTIVETDNTVYQKMRTTTIENAAQLMYEVNVYSNKTGYKKSEAKDIMDTIDQEFAALGFTRTMCNPVSNLQDATIYRIVARYTGVVVPEISGADKNLRIYTN